jgi:hypothetical protein
MWVDPRIRLTHYDGCVAFDACVADARFVKEEEAELETLADS